MKKKEIKIKTNNAEPYLIYGLSYKVIHDDSKYYDDHEEWFENEEKRDCVYTDWSSGKYWDSINDCELKYRTPEPNYNHSLTKKISKFISYREEIETTYVLTNEEYLTIITAIDNDDWELIKPIFNERLR